jgi:methyl-accepting chemotaxis protein
VRRVTDIVGEMSAAAVEQSIGIEQIGTAMTQVDQATQSNLLQTEELSSTARNLSRQSAGLLRLLETFAVNKAEPGNASRASLRLRA